MSALVAAAQPASLPSCRGCHERLLATSAVAILRNLCPACDAAGLAAVQAAKQRAIDCGFTRASTITADLAQRPLWSTAEPLIVRADRNQPYQLGSGRWFAVPTTTGVITVDEDGRSEHEDETLSAATLAAFRRWLAYDHGEAREEADEALAARDAAAEPIADTLGATGGAW